MEALDLNLVKQACQFLAGRIRRTPVEFSPGLSQAVGAEVYLKLECLQITGSFKLRGALFRLSRLSAQERAAGVATCSVGNHGKAVAYAAGQLGISATVYVPRDVDQSKHRGMVELGATVIRSDFPGYDDTLEWAVEQAAAAGLTFVSAFDDYAVMAGNGGTLAAETIQQAPEAETFILPVGGGGLSAGFAYYAKQKLPGCRLIGCQHELSPALALSLKQGQAVTKLPAAETVASGVEGGIGAMCFGVLGPLVDSVALVSEAEIRSAFRWMLENHQYLIEPTAAVPIAACLSGKIDKLAGRAVIIVSGRNVSVETVRRILSEVEQ